MRRIFPLACILLLCILPALSAQDGEAAAAGGTREPLPDESTLMFADSDPSPALSPVSSTTFTFWDFLRMFLILGGVIAGMYGFFFILKKFSGQRYRQSDSIRLVGTRMLTGNRSVHLVQVGRQVFLLGSSENSVNMLSEITDHEVVDELLLAQSEEETAERRTFADTLSGLLGTVRRTAQGPDSARAVGRGADNGGRRGQDDAGDEFDRTVGSSMDLLKQQQERLKKLRSP